MGMEVWVSVEIYGPQSEIDRFRAMCFVTDPVATDPENDLCIDFSSVSQRSMGNGPIWNLWDQPWNFSTHREAELGTCEFWFDVDYEFPTPIFDRLAILFPTLAFHCECITDGDEFMGYGWFNVPEGGEEFAFYDVPDGYWAEGGGTKRDSVAQAYHKRLVDKLRRVARQRSVN